MFFLGKPLNLAKFQESCKKETSVISSPSNANKVPITEETDKKV